MPSDRSGRQDSRRVSPDTDETTDTVQLLVADSGNRQTIETMLRDDFEVETSPEPQEADLYLVEDHLFPEYHEELRRQVEREQPAFCPVVLIRRGSTQLRHKSFHTGATDEPMLVDDVVDAPIDRALLIRRLHSLLVRRRQSQNLANQVETLKRREQTLRRFARGVAATGNGIVITNCEGTIEYVNPAFERITGYPGSDIVGKTPRVLLPPGTADRFDASFWKTMADREEWEDDIVIERESGERGVIDATTTPIRDGEGAIDGFVIVMSDITERIQREQTLQNREQELELLRQILTRYLRHNLRNDLNVILSNTQLLELEGDLSEEARKRAEKIIETTNRLMEKSDSARTYSTLLEREEELSPYNLSAAVRSVVGTIEASYPDVTVDCDIPESCQVYAHEGLERAIEELLDNAAQHNDADAPWIRIQVRDADVPTLVVEDNGPGISDIERAALERGSETPLSHSQGIGLWLSKWVIEGMDGELAIEPGDLGTRVTVTFASSDTGGTDSLEAPTLKEREQRLQTVLDRMTDAVVQVDSNWTLTFLDTRAAEILDLEADDILGRNFWDVFSDIRGTPLEQFHRDAMETRSSSSIEAYYEGIDSWVEVHDYPEFDGGLSIYFRDVTERKEHQQALQERVKELTAIHDASQVFEQTDTPLDELLTEFVRTVPESFQYPASTAARVTCDETTYSTVDFEPRRDSLSARAELGDGSELVLEVVILSDGQQDGEQPFLPEEQAMLETLVSLVAGHVQRRRSVEALERRSEDLKKQQQYLDAILNHTTQPLFMKRASGEYIFANQEYQRLFDLEERDIVGYTDFDLHATPMAEDVWDNDRKVLETGEPITVEERITVGDTERLYLSSKVPVSLEETTDGPDAVFGIATDITERQARQEELERINEQLESFVSVVSHDLRNPLNVAQTRLELAQEDCDSEHLRSIENAHTRMTDIIEEMLRLARSGQAIGEQSAVSLTSLVQEAWDNVDTQNGTFRDDGLEERKILADSDRLLQLLENLFRNSVEHAGEEVTVTVGPLPDGFYVADDGPGVPPEQRGAVFGGSDSTEDGSGLGLQIVDQIASAHGWDIALTTGEDGGARFEFTDVDVVD